MGTDVSTPFLAMELHEGGEAAGSKRQQRNVWPKRSIVLLHLSLISLYTIISAAVIHVFTLPNKVSLLGKFSSETPVLSLKDL